MIRRITIEFEQAPGTTDEEFRDIPVDIARDWGTIIDDEILEDTHVAPIDDVRYSGD